MQTNSIGMTSWMGREGTSKEEITVQGAVRMEGADAEYISHKPI